MPEIRRQIEVLECLVGEQALIRQIVNSKHGGRPMCLTGEQGRDQTGLPIITVNQVWLPVEPELIVGELDYRFGKNCITRGIVGPGMTIGTEN